MLRTIPSHSYNEDVSVVGRQTEAVLCPSGQPASLFEPVQLGAVGTPHWLVHSVPKFPYQLLVVADDPHQHMVTLQEAAQVMLGSQTVSPESKFCILIRGTQLNER